MSVPLLVGAPFSNSGVLLAAALLAAALLWPSAPGGVYLAAVAWGVARWAGGRGTWLAGAGAPGALQAWCGAHLVLLYLAQVRGSGKAGASGRGVSAWAAAGSGPTSRLPLAADAAPPLGRPR
jgi:hypothetical protein